VEREVVDADKLKLMDSPISTVPDIDAPGTSNELSGGAPPRTKRRSPSRKKPAPVKSTHLFWRLPATLPPHDLDAADPDLCELLTARRAPQFKDDTGRFPNWRWNAAVYILAEFQRPYPNGTYDNDVALAMQTIRLLQRQGRARIQWFPWFDAVYQLRTRECERRRWELESRVLARQTVDEIADVMGLSRDVVNMYERLFFDVRGTLDAKSHIMHRVIRLYENNDFATSIEKQWKYFAYRDGLHVFELFLNRKVPRPIDPNGNLNQQLVREFLSELELNLYLSAHTVNYSLKECQKLERQMQKIDAIKASMCPPENFQANIDCFWKQLLSHRSESSSPLAGQLPPVQSANE
jgi:hypothetical protein